MLTAIIIHSCRKEVKLSQQEINAEIAAAKFPVADAKSWFGANKTALANKVKINSDASVLNMLSEFTPVWDSARTAVDTNYYVVEVPARYLQKLAFTTDSNGTNINGVTRLLLLKSKKYGAITAVLMHVHGNTGLNISNVHYMSVPTAFSGNVFYTGLQGGFICGYMYENGKITKSAKGSSVATKPGGLQILLAQNPGDNCTTVITNWLMQSCYYNGDGSFDHCTLWKYAYTTFDTYCNDSDDGGGGGGGLPEPPQCPEGTHPANSGGGSSGGGGPNVESINGKLVVRFTDSYVANCVPDSIATQKQIDSTKLSDCFKKVLNALNNIDNHCIADYINLFSGDTQGFNWTMKDGSAGSNNGQTKPLYANGTVTTEFNSSNYVNGSDLAIARTILHESVHAYLVAYFRLDPISANQTYSELVDKWMSQKHPDLNELQHDLMITNFVGDLSTQLELYGQNQGYNIPSQYYSDLIWGGLTDTKAFKALNQTTKNRIMDVLNTEQNGTDRLGNSTSLKGQLSKCK